MDTTSYPPQSVLQHTHSPSHQVDDEDHHHYRDKYMSELESRIPLVQTLAEQTRTIAELQAQLAYYQQAATGVEGLLDPALFPASTSISVALSSSKSLVDYYKDKYIAELEARVALLTQKETLLSAQLEACQQTSSDHFIPQSSAYSESVLQSLKVLEEIEASVTIVDHPEEVPDANVDACLDLELHISHPNTFIVESQWNGIVTDDEVTEYSLGDAQDASMPTSPPIPASPVNRPHVGTVIDEAAGTDDKLALVHNCRVTSLICKICQRVFSELSQLRIHEKRHVGDKNHQCAECGKSFVRPYQLTEHQRRHRGVRPYPCGHCDKQFYTSGERVKHSRLKHSG